MVTERSFKRVPIYTGYSSSRHFCLGMSFEYKCHSVSKQAAYHQRRRSFGVESSCFRILHKSGLSMSRGIKHDHITA